MLISKVFDFCNITSYIFNLHQFNYLHAKFQIDSCTGTPCSQKHGPVTKFPLTSLYAYIYIYIYIYMKGWDEGGISFSSLLQWVKNTQ